MRVVEQRIAVAYAEVLAMMGWLPGVRERAAGFERINGRPPGADDYRLILVAVAAG